MHSGVVRVRQTSMLIVGVGAAAFAALRISTVRCGLLSRDGLFRLQCTLRALDQPFVLRFGNLGEEDEARMRDHIRVSHPGHAAPRGLGELLRLFATEQEDE